MKGSSIKGASISDIHLGHLKTPTKLITSNLNTAFGDNASTAALDIIFLAGDVFDRMLQVPEPDAYVARAWAHRFLTICAKHRIVVRVLEGTPRHDRRQSRMFDEVIELTDLELDFKYVDVLTIEFIESLGINVLYIPDEWRHTPEETYSEVLQAMNDKQLSTVDFAIMHGCFEYQLPDVESVRRSAHRTENYLPLVTGFIFIGHHHVFSQYQHIVAHGSFDRLVHGEEGPKGHIRFEVGRDVKKITFVENKGAMQYRTVSVYDMSYTDVVEKIRALNLPEGSFVRTAGSIMDLGVRMLRHLKKDFPELVFTTPLVEKQKKEEIVAVKSSTYVPVQISQTNIVGLVRDWMIRNNHSEAEIRDCEVNLNEQINSRAG